MPRASFLFLFLLSFSLNELHAQKRIIPEFECDYGAVINLASPRKDIIIQGFHVLRKACMPGKVDMTFVGGPNNKNRIDITVYDTDEAVLHQPHAIPAMAPIIKGSLSLGHAFYQAGRTADSMVALGIYKGPMVKKLPTIKKIRGFEVLDALSNNSPGNLGHLAITVKNRYVIILDMQSYMDFHDDHDESWAFLSPFLEAFSLEALK